MNSSANKTCFARVFSVTSSFAHILRLIIQNRFYLLFKSTFAFEIHRKRHLPTPKTTAKQPSRLWSSLKFIRFSWSRFLLSTTSESTGRFLRVVLHAIDSLNVKHELRSKKIKQFCIMQTFSNDISRFAT